MILDQELETFQRELPHLLKEHRGKYALVQGEAVDSVSDTENHAIEAGDDRFGLKPFLVKKIQEREKPLIMYVDLISGR